MITGTIVNASAIVAGSLLGLAIHKNMPSKITGIVFQAIALFTIVLGVSMAMKTNNYLNMIFSLVIGCVIGELIDIEARIEIFAEKLKGKFKSKNDRFTEGFVTSFLLFCMGSLAILGAIEDGLGHSPDLLYTKSILDGFSSIALAASMGLGVLFSAIPLLIYQGAISLFAGGVQGFFSQQMITELSATGGILLLGLGISILDIKRIKVSNMLPSLVIAVILTAIFG